MSFFLVSIGGVFSFFLSNYFPFISGAIVLGASVFLIIKKKPLLVLFLFMVLTMSHARQELPLEPFLCKNSVIEAYSTSLAVQNPFGYHFQGTITAQEGCGDEIIGKHAVLFSKEPVSPYTRILFTGDLKGTCSSRNPYDLTASVTLSGTVRRYHERIPLTGLMRQVHAMRNRLLTAFEKEFPAPVSGLLSTVILGERSLLPGTIRQSFSGTGLSHLLAISGTHFGVFSLMVFWLIRQAILLLPYRLLNRITLFLKPSDAAALASIPFMIFYLLLSGMGIPALRSFFMINVVLIGFLTERKAAWRNSLAFAGAVILLVSPESVKEPSFFLSFSAVAVIGFVIEWRDRIRSRTIPLPDHVKTMGDRALERAGTLALLTGAAIVGTLPLTMYLFHSIPLLSFPMNLIMTPLVCFILIPIVLISSLTFLFTGFFPFSALINILSSLVIKGTTLVSGIPFVHLPVPAFPPAFVLLAYAGIALIFIAGKKRAGLILLCLFLCSVVIYPLIRRKPDFEITFLDTGQAESAVMTMPDGKVFVLDTGRTGKQPSRYLDYLGKGSIDALFLTHGGIDHSGGTGYLFLTKDVKNLFDNGDVRFDFDLPASVQYRRLRRGDTIKGPGYILETLHPYDGFTSFSQTSASNDNNGSLVLRLNVEGFRFLFTGDIEKETEQDLLSLGPYLESDLIKVAHHGSRTSSTKPFLSLSGPTIGIISSGKFNMYGHPHSEALSRLKGMDIYNTADDGAVKAALYHTGERPSLRISSFRETGLRTAHTPGDELLNLKRIFSTW